MFAVRGIAVSFSVFIMIYCALSVAVACCWRRIPLHAPSRPAHQLADLLFALRMFPLVAAALITAAFTVPSFVLLEPRSIDEPIGAVPLVLGSFGVLVVLFGITNAVRSLWKAARTIFRWTNSAEVLTPQSSVPVLRISPALPPMTAAGIFRPRVLLSAIAEFLLTGNELQRALNHEIAHIRRRDNLKKLLLRFVSFPGMASLEEAWSEATEIAADDAAVTNASEALDLAAALIKLSRLSSRTPAVDLTAALIHSPASLVNTRVERLIAWTAPRYIPGRRSPWYGLAAAGVTVALFALTYHQMLMHLHTATEWLVR